ncbi:MAG: YdcF family protein, partial [Candidatus Nomurabacteria bacterium]|nr:YdcF family protein [Candidatus Nomurabacteria bacterium]
DLKKCLANESCEPADAVVVISGGDTNARVDEAVRLYKAGVAAKILMSGAAADKNGPSNAVVMRNHALELGVSLSDIILEDQAANTRQNAEFSQKIVAENGWRRVVLVTSAYHQRRAGMEFRRALGGEVVVYDHPTNSDRSWGAVWWLTPVGWWLALSELTGIVWFNVR